MLRFRHLFRDKYAFVFIDLEAVAGADLPDTVAYIASEMVNQLRERLEPVELALPTKTHDFLAFLETCARALRTVRIAVLLDEIGALRPETSMRLTSAIRAVFTTRLVKPAFARYAFVVAGATDALELAVGRNSPLKNVTETLYLEDLSEAETNQLVAEMFQEVVPPPDADLYRALHEWTNGHPYLTQRLAETLHSQTIEAHSAKVNHAAKQLLRTEDRNLPYVLHALDANRTLRDLTAAMVAGTPITFTRANNAIAKLELIGLLRNDRGRCAIRNRIYREALRFDPIKRVPAPARDLRAFVERLNESTDVETLLQAATMQLQTIAQSGSVVALAVQPDRRLEIVANIGALAGPIEPTPFQPEGSALDGLVGCAELATIGFADAESEWLRHLGSALIVPVRLKNSLAALFCLGPKLSGEEYGSEEREFLTSLADQTAAGIDRIRLRSLQRDADKAWEIQRALLPAELPRLAGFTIAGSCRPARVVSGDYYDAFELSDHALAICIADVKGKGMPAALLMANLQGTLKILATDTMTPRQLCGSLNQMLSRTIGAGEFITFFYGVLDTDSRRLLYTNAGHNHPIVVRRGGDVVRLGDGGPLLGIFADAPYTDGSITLDPGDRLVLFTDGVVEAPNHKGEEFGDDRLISIIRASADGTDAQALLRGVTDALQQFNAGAFQDDVTLLAIAS